MLLTANYDSRTVLSPENRCTRTNITRLGGDT